ncbi:L-piperidine-6-carboxylate dehydrogenase [Chondromyces apiculatus]|uniref:aldehyde dehydrogenase (NAD(+)) n=1 Tax=Chondromyces apiculatus DSM 436 TaxID=1192034 RepID=A0A017THY8_9BACT|nr:aldehyde dehydrogenase family protein [Chondromyces apiculatus]EYF08869.1 Aldehyde dehydrogenase B [Chondromyces apiculatus DSM 436]
MTVDVNRLLEELGVSSEGMSGVCASGFREASGAELETLNPSTGEVLGRVRTAARADYDAVVDHARERFAAWRMRPAPRRGEVVRRLGELLRQHKEALGALVSLEMGKILSEGLGEVQEMIDICDFAVGLSRQLHGLTMASERPRHRMMEQWHPLGTVGVITAFNFPVAVWAWNVAIAAICGDACVWKPSPVTPLCSVAVQRLVEQAFAEHEADGVLCLAVGGAEAGEWMADDVRLPLVSFTGSIPVGRQVATRIGSRLGRSLLELGGNNAVVVLDDADLELAVRAITFGAVGTAGQRCTSTRRVFAQRGISGQLTERLIAAYETVRIGDPLEEGTLMGPLSTREAVLRYEAALRSAGEEGGEVLWGGKALDRPGFFVEPALVWAPRQHEFSIAWKETFAPILYLFDVGDLDEAIAAQNAVTQGLSSAIFTDSMRAAEQFLSAMGSDCGIANVNIGTSGAEIGGAFGGEKETGGGREAGSDAWKAYMRRQTCTINWGSELPLAQGVRFL